MIRPASLPATLLLLLLMFAPAAPGRAAPAAADVDSLLARYYDPGIGARLDQAGRALQPMLDERSTARAPEGTIAGLRRMMVFALFEDDRRTFYCNRLAARWWDEAGPLSLALPVCRHGLDTTQDLCILFDERRPALDAAMRGFARRYGDPRLALGSDDRRFWNEALACGAARDGTRTFVPLAGVPVVPLTEEPRAPPTTVRYVSELLASFLQGPLPPPDDPALERQIAGYDRVSMRAYRGHLDSFCPHAAEHGVGLLRAMECVATGNREPVAAPGTRPAGDVSALIRHHYDPAPMNGLGQAERAFIPALARPTTASLGQAEAARLKRLMVFVLFEHERRTNYCNALGETWRAERLALYFALPICRAGPDTSQDLCALFSDRAPAIAGLMGRFATLYADPRLALDAGDLAFWRRTFGCREPAAVSAPMPRTQIRPITELLTIIADRQLQGLEPLDRATTREWGELIGDFDTFRNVLRMRCGRSPSDDESLLQTMECRAAGHRER